MSFNRLKHGMPALLASAVLFSAPVFAAPTLSTYAVVWTPTHVLDNGKLAGNTISANASSSAPYGSAQATTSATYGVVKAGIAGTNGSSGAYAGGTSVTAGASAGYRDLITLSNPALNGTRGLITLSYYIDYDATASVVGEQGGYSNGSISFTAWLGSSYSQLTHYLADGALGNDRSELTQARNDYYGYSRSATGPLNYLYVTSEFTWGSAFETGITTDLNASTHALNGQSAMFDFDALHSGYWGGVTLAQANGVAISDFTVTSVSGVDYSNSFAPAQDVPEPGSLVLIGSGLVGLVLRRRRKE